LKFGEESELKNLIKNGEDIHLEAKSSPRLYYLNIPKKFVTGTVYDPVVKEVITGVTCTLTDDGSNKKYTTATDGFWRLLVRGLVVGNFSLKLAKDAKEKKIFSINTVSDVNLGDITLT